jgi:hypothetical protein
MARYRVLSWRGIPAQVKASGDDGGRAVSRQLSDWFVQEIDRVAMRDGLVGSDAYLAEWKWSEYRERPGSADEVADAVAAELEAEWAERRGG